MALIQADRVRETSSTTGSANFTLVGAVDGFQRFSAAIGSANTCYYAATDGSAFEVGLGTVSANVLARTTVLDSSHTSSGTVHRVAFEAGTKDIFATYAADKAVILDADGNLTVGTTADISTLGNVSVAKTLTISSGVSGASTLNIKGAVSAGTTLGVTGNASVTGTFLFATASTTGNLNVAKDFGVVEDVSIGTTLLITGNTTAKGTLTVGGAFSTNSTSRFEGESVFDSAVSVGGTFHVQGNASAQGTLNVKGAVSVASTLGVEGDIDNETGNLTINPATQIVEIKGDGASVEGQFQLNCHANSHGQRVRAQPHSEGVTNTMFLPKGVSSTLVSQVGTATLTHKTLDIIPSISVTGTLNIGGAVTGLSTVSDSKGDIRDLDASRTSVTATEIALTDLGQMVRLNSAGVQALIPSANNMTGAFSLGDITSICNTTSTTGAITSQITSFIAGAVSSTGTIILGANGIANIYFVSAGGCIITGNVR